ncbi:MAG: hypothetical protein KAQ87_03760 [Candidatus Pacebacteria bacterium]|nr:hypothetical protein [Candidatus Paceibacterota bacterium]
MKNNNKIVLLIIIILTIIGFSAVYFLFLNKEDSNESSPEEVIKAEINKELDTDQDGLPDYLEKILGTDENNPDTDGDNYSDFEEIKSGYNPLTDKKYTKEEWEDVKEEIKNKDEGFYERMFIGNLLEKRDILTMAGSKDYANRLAEAMIEYDATTDSLITHNTILVTSDFPDDKEEKVIEILTSFKIRKTAKEVTQEDRDLKNFLIVGNPDTNDFLREIYNKTVVVDVADERDFSVNKSVMKFAENPWNKDRIISIAETDYSHGGVIDVSGRIIVEKVGDFYHIVINTDENESYALVASFGIKDGNLVQFDGKNVEINGYRRINNSSNIQFEDSIGVIDIKIAE